MVTTYYITLLYYINKTKYGELIAHDVVNLKCSKPIATTVASFLTTYKIKLCILYFNVLENN